MGLEFGDVEGERLVMVVGDGELEGRLLCDGTEGAGVAIRHIQADGVREGCGRNVVFVNEVGVDE